MEGKFKIQNVETFTVTNIGKTHFIFISHTLQSLRPTKELMYITKKMFSLVTLNHFKFCIDNCLTGS